ncbi:MAG: SRPBCC family protein [Rhodospirillales bacterium]
MATIEKTLVVSMPLDKVWEAFADYHAVDKRIATGFVVNCEANDGGRTVTFANGLVADEQLVSMDHAKHRLTYAIKGGRLSHHNASFQLTKDGKGTRIVWHADLLPNDLEHAISGMMDLGVAAMQRKLGTP